MSNDSDLWKAVNNIETEVQQKTGIKETALLDLFRDAVAAGSDTGGALRTIELCELMGWGETRVRKLLHALKKAGLIEVVKIQMDSSQTLGGARSWATAYRLVGDDD